MKKSLLLIIILCLMPITGYSGIEGTPTVVSEYEDYFLFWDYSDDGTLKKCVGNEIRNIHNSAFAYVSTSGTQTIDSNVTFEKLDEGTIAYTSTHRENFAHSDGRLTYNGTETIHAFINVDLSVKSGEISQTVRFRIAENGSTIAGTDMSTDFTAQTKSDCVGLSWLIELATNDYIEIFGTSDTDGDTFDINNMAILIMEED